MIKVHLRKFEWSRSIKENDFGLKDGCLFEGALNRGITLFLPIQINFYARKFKSMSICVKLSFLHQWNTPQVPLPFTDLACLFAEKDRLKESRTKWGWDSNTVLKVQIWLDIDISGSCMWVELHNRNRNLTKYFCVLFQTTANDLYRPELDKYWNR